jgi:hypothetical protein
MTVGRLKSPPVLALRVHFCRNPTHGYITATSRRRAPTSNGSFSRRRRHADRALTVTDAVGRKVHYAYCAPGDGSCAANQVRIEYRGWQSGTACAVAGTLQACYRQVAYNGDGEEASSYLRRFA